MATQPASKSGRLSLEELLELIRTGEIETVVTVLPDMYGRLVGKRITGPFFADETAEHGMHVCDYLLACDMEMDPVPGYGLTSWDTGYGDFLCVPDWGTLRRASWLEKSAIVICDVLDEEGSTPVSVAPRAILRRQMERARIAGYLPVGASELEFFVFKHSYAEARERGYAGLETFGGYIEDYHILQGTRVEPLVGSIRRHLESSGVPVEFSKGEWGPGQHEINLRYCELLEMADRHVLYKNAAKEIADSQGLALTFMAKWASEHAGNSMHVHTSLCDISAPSVRLRLRGRRAARRDVGAGLGAVSALAGRTPRACARSHPVLCAVRKLLQALCRRNLRADSDRLVVRQPDDRLPRSRSPELAARRVSDSGSGREPLPGLRRAHRGGAGRTGTRAGARGRL